MNDLKLYFTTDIHGSERCFRKFVKAGQFYDCNVVIMGGDLSGKGVVPFLKNKAGGYTVSFLDENHDLVSEQDKKDLEEVIRNAGYYPYVTNEDEVGDVRLHPEKLEEIYRKLCVKSIEEWLTRISDFNKDKKYTYYITPGNDDIFAIDKILPAGNIVINPEGQALQIDENVYMISSGYTNKTPWDTERELSEEEIRGRIDAMMMKVPQGAACIFNLHCPPHNTNLDEAPELNQNLQQKTNFGQMVMGHVGSVSVREAIMKYQPLLSLHGHIHESKATQKLGKTIAINPGSEYGEGILRGAIAVIGMGGIISKKISVKSYMHVSG